MLWLVHMSFIGAVKTATAAINAARRNRDMGIWDLAKLVFDVLFGTVCGTAGVMNQVAAMPLVFHRSVSD